MTRRKDPQPETDPPQEAPPPEQAVTAEPFVVADPADAPPLATDPPSPPEPTVVVRRGSFLAPLLGGAVAAIGGFALSHFDLLNLRAVDTSAELAGLSSQVTEIQARTASLDKLGADLAAISDRLGRLESTPPPEPPDLSGLEALDQRLSAIEAMPAEGGASNAALAAKLAEIERRLSDLPQGASDELQQKLDAALARLDEAEATAEARASEAAAATAAAGRARAIEALEAKVDAGEAFGAELQAVGDPALAETLSALSEAGVPTLAHLQAAFPDAAREALRMARSSGTDDGWGDRILNFLAAQTGARPVTPLEGDTPDAILSRADFALSEGRLTDAVAEVQTLDPSVGTALDPWLAEAQAHLAAKAALSTARGE